MNNVRLSTFVGSTAGAWQITKIAAVVGDVIQPCERMDVIQGSAIPNKGVSWQLTGVTSNARYTTFLEKQELLAKQANLGRKTSTLPR